MSRTIAFAEWATAAAIAVWVIVFWVLTSAAELTLTLGITVSSVFFGLGLILSLGINGAVHFRRRPLGRVEAVFLVLEALVILLMIVAGIADQYEYSQLGPYSTFGDLGHWLDWFTPLWVLIGPIALTVTIIALVKRSALPPRVVAPAPAEVPPVA